MARKRGKKSSTRQAGGRTSATPQPVAGTRGTLGTDPRSVPNPESRKERLLLAALAACFFLSGFAALLYQAAWLKKLGVVFGTSHIGRGHGAGGLYGGPGPGRGAGCPLCASGTAAGPVVRCS